MRHKGLNQRMIMKALDYAYGIAIDGIPGFDSAEELALNYMDKGTDKGEICQSLIKWQIAKAGSSGFLTGLGGIITMPVTIPANLSSVMYVQIRMIAAIAFVGGYDLKDDRVKTLVYMCLAGNAAKDILKDMGIVLGRRLTIEMIKNISEKTIITINQKVGFTLLSKVGQKGAINLGKAVPLIGGVIGGTFDSITTMAIGKIAVNTFIETKKTHTTTSL
jgi:hypothetical protein